MKHKFAQIWRKKTMAAKNAKNAKDAKIRLRFSFSFFFNLGKIKF